MPSGLIFSGGDRAAWQSRRPRLLGSGGAVEGMDNKIKSISHWSFGFRTAEHFIAAIYHCCARLRLPSNPNYTFRTGVPKIAAKRTATFSAVAGAAPAGPLPGSGSFGWLHTAAGRTI